MNNIETFLKDTLHNKMAYVSAFGLLLEGTIEQKCKLEFAQYSGIKCLVQLEYNNSSLIKDVEQILIQNKEEFNISYDVRDQIINAIIPTMKKSFVQAGMISCNNISNINITYREKQIHTIKLQYENGNVVMISNIQEIKN